MPTPTLRDVAEAAGVHPATASRALNPATRGLVNADTARRVIKVAESLGYRPNPIARGLKTAKSGTIGLVIPDLTNPLFPPIVRGIEEVLEPAGYSGADRQHRQRPRARAGADRVAALAAGRGADRRHGAARPPADGGAPPRGRADGDGQPPPGRASTSRRSPPTTPPASSSPSSTSPSLGHRRIAHLAGPATTSTGVARARAFRGAVRDLGLDDDPALVADLRLLERGGRRDGAAGRCSTPARTSPRSSPATT